MKTERRFSFGAWLIFAVALAAVLCLGFVAGCNEEVCQPSAWLMVGPDADTPDNPVIARAGIVNKDGIEFGAESTWLGYEGGQAYGVYALQEFTAVEIAGTQYVGGHAAMIDVDDEGNSYGFITGTAIPVRGNIEAVIEYQFNEYEGAVSRQLGTDDDSKVYAGLRIKF